MDTGKYGTWERRDGYGVQYEMDMARYCLDMNDNNRDRFSYGYDAGVIVDGEVKRDDAGKIILVDDDGEIFCPDEALGTLIGKKARMTIISFEAIENMERMYAAAQAAMGKSD